MKKISLYQVAWSNNHASDVFPIYFTNFRKAETFARTWRQDMIASDELPHEAKDEYVAELIKSTFYVEKDWGVYKVYDKEQCPRSPVVKEALWKHVIPALISKLKTIKKRKRA